MTLALALVVGAAVYLVLQMTEAASTSGVPSAGRLNASQLAQLASAAGFQGSDLATAVAIALAESGGNPAAYNPETAAGAKPGAGSYGLWQIYLTAHPEYTAAQLLDPQTNANAAFKIYTQAGGAFNPWSTYNVSNAYMNYADVAQAATGFPVSA